MNCRLFRRHLDAFLDGEVDPATQIEFERHVSSCAGCQEQFAFERAARSANKEVLSAVRAPDALRARVMETLASPVPAQKDAPLIRVFMLPARYSVPMAAAAVVLFLAGGVIMPRFHNASAVTAASAGLPIFEDVVRLHSAQLPSDVANPAQDQVLSWFRDKVEFPVRPAAFEGNPDVHLLGARLSTVGQHRAALLYYDVHGRRMTVVMYARPEPNDDASAPGVYIEKIRGRTVAYKRVGGYTVSSMQHDGVTYVITGDMDHDALLRLAASANVR